MNPEHEGGSPSVVSADPTPAPTNTPADWRIVLLRRPWITILSVLVVSAVAVFELLIGWAIFSFSLVMSLVSVANLFSPKVPLVSFLYGPVFREQSVETFFRVFRRVTVEVAWVALAVLIAWLGVLLATVQVVESLAALGLNVFFVYSAVLFVDFVLGSHGKETAFSIGAHWRRLALSLAFGILLLLALNVTGYALSMWIESDRAEPHFRLAKERLEPVNLLRVEDMHFRQASSMREFKSLYVAYYRITAPADRYLLYHLYHREGYDLWAPPVADPTTAQKRAENEFKEAFDREQAQFDSKSLGQLRELFNARWKQNETAKRSSFPPELTAQYWVTIPRERWADRYAAVATASKVAAMDAWVKLTDQWYLIRVVVVLVVTVLAAYALLRGITWINRRYDPEFAPPNHFFFTAVAAISLIVAMLDQMVR